MFTLNNKALAATSLLLLSSHTFADYNHKCELHGSHKSQTYQTR